MCARRAVTEGILLDDEDGGPIDLNNLRDDAPIATWNCSCISRSEKLLAFKENSHENNVKVVEFQLR